MSAVASRSIADDEREAAIAFLRREGYKQPIGAADRFFVSELAGAIVAVVRLAPEEGVLVLRGMRVRADMQRRGVGRQLLAELAAAVGPRTCYCIPYRWLVPFYGEVGFREVTPDEVPQFLARRCAKYVREGQDAILMRRRSPSS